MLCKRKQMSVAEVSWDEGIEREREARNFN
jgi:hypothetical protein